MSPEAAIVLAERILALGEGVASLVEQVVSAVEEGKSDKAAYYGRLAALGASSGASAYSESQHAGHPRTPVKS